MTFLYCTEYNFIYDHWSILGEISDISRECVTLLTDFQNFGGGTNVGVYCYFPNRPKSCSNINKHQYRSSESILGAEPLNLAQYVANMMGNVHRKEFRKKSLD